MLAVELVLAALAAAGYQAGVRTGRLSRAGTPALGLWLVAVLALVAAGWTA